MIYSDLMFVHFGLVFVLELMRRRVQEGKETHTLWNIYHDALGTSFLG
jgi:hypothetical protein